MGEREGVITRVFYIFNVILRGIRWLDKGFYYIPVQTLSILHVYSLGFHISPGAVRCTKLRPFFSVLSHSFHLNFI